MPSSRAEVFSCDLCSKTWPRGEMTVTVLRAMVAHHLWVEHAIRRADSGDMLPMTDDEIAWVRSQRG